MTSTAPLTEPPDRLPTAASQMSSEGQAMPPTVPVIEGAGWATQVAPPLLVPNSPAVFDASVPA
ncbi:MAG TPA: hypothetical protein VH012_06055 [Acidimicrobiales bacterium]|nr:hypothetical protein [Acidimicrobiales bacterium]